MARPKSSQSAVSSSIVKVFCPKITNLTGNFTDRAWYEARGFFSTRTQYLFSCVNIEPEKAKKKKKNKISATKEEPKKEEAKKEESRKSIGNRFRM